MAKNTIQKGEVLIKVVSKCGDDFCIRFFVDTINFDALCVLSSDELQRLGVFLKPEKLTKKIAKYFDSQIAF